MTAAPSGPDENSDRLQVYLMLVEMADRVSQRRQSANAFYLSINSGLVGGFSFLAQGDLPKMSAAAISVAGVAICFLWVRSILSYRTLNEAKFKVIQGLETHLPAAPFTDEWKLLDVDGDGRRHTPFSAVEIRVPWVFAVVHFLQLVSEIFLS